MKRSIWVLSGVIGVLVLCSVALVVYRRSISPKEAIERFQEDAVAESQIIDPLFWAGENVVPELIKLVIDKNMVRRRYAISFLGQIESSQALQTLKSIAMDEEEEFYIRGDAIVAIYSIDKALSEELARRYESENEIQIYTEDILAGREPRIIQKRSFWKAIVRSPY